MRGIWRSPGTLVLSVAESEFIQESEQRGRDIKSWNALQAGPQKGMVLHFAASTGRFW